MTQRIASLSCVTMLVLFGAAACGGDGRPDDGGDAAAVDLVAPDEFAARMADPAAVVVNVHVPYEGEIAGTDLFVPFDEIASSDALPDDKASPLLIYCRSGNMSAEATADLVDAGYTEVTDLDGGMLAWEAGGRSIEVLSDRQ